MYSSLRQKACVACSVSKRGCDKQLPECQRCLDRDLDCVYPQSKKRRREHVECESQAQHHLPSAQYFMDVNTLGNNFDPEPWGVMGASNLEASLSETLFPYIQTPSVSVTGQSTRTVVHERSELSDASTPWFLQGETWVIERVTNDTDCVVDVELELKSFIRSVAGMLQFWAKNGHNSFIHRRLYEKGMPACIQDAFTTLTTYNSRTPAVEEAILQIAAERSSALTRHDLPTVSGAQCVLAHLARVQALFIYEFIMLFDGSVRVRASAEKHLPILRQWHSQLLETVKEYRGEERLPDHEQWAESDFDKEYCACSELWKSWILTESVRRTYVLVECITNVFEAMTRGWAECEGAVMVTTRCGLWEAESAMEWSELSSAKSPIIVPSLRPAPVMERYDAEEIDDLLKKIWAVIVGSDRIQYWSNRKNRMKRN